MNLVDSSGWIEHFKEGPNAAHFAGAIRDEESLLVPTIIILEVVKFTLRTAGRERAMLVQGHLQSRRVVDLTAELAALAAIVGPEEQLPLADSIIMATARVHGATIWTQDEHFKGLPGVKYFPSGRKN